MTEEDVLALCARYRLTPLQLVRILSECTISHRLDVALDLLREAWGPDRRFKHRELAEVCCSSRENVSRALPGRLP